MKLIEGIAVLVWYRLKSVQCLSNSRIVDSIVCPLLVRRVGFLYEWVNERWKSFMSLPIIGIIMVLSVMCASLMDPSYRWVTHYSIECFYRLHPYPFFFLFLFSFFFRRTSLPNIGFNAGYLRAEGPPYVLETLFSYIH